MRDFIHSKGNKHIWIPLMQEFWIQNKPGEQSQKIFPRESSLQTKNSPSIMVHNHCNTYNDTLILLVPHTSHIPWNPQPAPYRKFLACSSFFRLGMWDYRTHISRLGPYESWSMSSRLRCLSDTTASNMNEIIVKTLMKNKIIRHIWSKRKLISYGQMYGNQLKHHDWSFSILDTMTWD
jgi:hypothetical protein